MTVKGCYTCRRRRIVCDNGLPTCRKCRNAGKECLGYQKPLVWVKGVASRGKMMGRSINDVVGSGARESSSDSKNERDSAGLTPTLENSVIQTGSSSLGVLTPNYEVSRSVVRLGSNGAGIPGDCGPDYVPMPWGLVDPLFKDFNRIARSYMFHCEQSYHNHLGVHIHKLTIMLSAVSQHMATILALYPNVKNPYRDLTLLVGDSPVLAQALSAIGALHYALLANGDFSSIPWASNETGMAGTLPSANAKGRLVINSTSNRPIPKAYEHFLWFKQRALRQLSLDLSDPVKQNDDRTIAATIALALLDAVESGSGAWKYHLEGAKNLLKSRQDEYRNGGRPRGLIMDELDNFVIEGCLLFEIMGSTLAKPGSLSKPFYTASMGRPAVLKRLEQTSFVGCPAYLLEVIFFVHAQWYSESQNLDSSSSQPTTAECAPLFLAEGSKPIRTPSALLRHIQAFDPSAWAEEMQSFHSLPDLSARIGLAAAYKAAVYLYVSRVLSRPRSSSATASFPARSSLALPADHKAVSDGLVHQLSLIPRADPHFKCLLWPTFIAGAETRYPSKRGTILELLSRIYQAILSVNVRNAAWVLTVMWQKKDLNRQERRNRQRADDENHQQHLFVGPCNDDPIADMGDGSDDDDNDNNDLDEEFDWIQELDNSQIDWLFI